jgi:hypothetical protein
MGPPGEPMLDPFGVFGVPPHPAVSAIASATIARVLEDKVT